MDTLKDFYDFYRPLQRKYDLQMIYKTNSKVIQCFILAERQTDGTK